MVLVSPELKSVPFAPNSLGAPASWLNVPLEPVTRWWEPPLLSSKVTAWPALMVTSVVPLKLVPPIVMVAAPDPPPPLEPPPHAARPSAMVRTRPASAKPRARTRRRIAHSILLAHRCPHSPIQGCEHGRDSA